MSVRKQAWWKESVIYQIYPASFLDSNGDGWGDVPGVITKLDYLRELGVDIIWLSPIYKSPFVDMGYDISDYEDIDPSYGTLEDVDLLISELKKRDMKLMMDLVVNHTSDQHPWFKESRSSLSNPKRDWYIWKKPKFAEDGTRLPPNNWAMILGGGNKSVWTWDETTEEYYLTLFTAEQADLNWENPEVREAVHNVLRFWLDRGACGFRMDVINMISKDQRYLDAEVTQPENKYQIGYKFYANGPRLHEFLKDMNQKVLTPYKAITVGEMPHINDEDEILRCVGAEADELNMIFIFDIVDVDSAPNGEAKVIYPWDANDLRKVVSRWQRVMYDKDGWNAIFCENHDQPRSVSRYTDDSDRYRIFGSKLMCLMMTTLAGTLYVFQGQELGMRNVPLEWDVKEFKDVSSINHYET
jgi:oligo-1,6-glucosidase